MKIELDLSDYFQDFVSKRLWKDTSGVAKILPYILEDIFPDLSVLHLSDKRLVCLEDFQEHRWKVWCSREDSFDIAPSKTKGCGRDKDGVDILYDAKQKYDGVILVNTKDVKNVLVYWYDWKTLPVDDKGRVIL